MRTNIAEIKKVITTTLADDNINALLEVANNIVNGTFVSGDLDSERLKLIEKYLTAHLIATTLERQEQQHKVGEVAVTFAQKLGEGLRSSTYGMVVISLDSTGKLVQQGNVNQTVKLISL